MMKKRISGFLILMLMISAFSSVAEAQLNNRPFSFKTPSGGVGMSLGGKQAILNERIYDSTPRNLSRAPDGSLLDITKGPEGVALASVPGADNFIPSYRGTSFRGGNADMSVGVFNAYFTPQNSGGGGADSYAHYHSSAVVSTWTGRVVSGGEPVSYLPGNSVDNWTSMVYSQY